jgi:hypothetical protein
VGFFFMVESAKKITSWPSPFTFLQTSFITPLYLTSDHLLLCNLIYYQRYTTLNSVYYIKVKTLNSL